MQRYLTHLQADIEVAIAGVPKFSEYANSFTFRDFDEDQTGFAPVKYLKLHDLFNLAPQAFPPVDLLNKPQLTDLLRQIETLWNAYHVRFEFPYGLKARKRYTAMTKFMATEIIAFSFDDGAEVDFCSDLKHCPFGDANLCECKRIINELDDDIWVSNHPELFLGSEETLDIEEEIRLWLDPDQEFLYWEDRESSEKQNPFGDHTEPLEYLYFYQKDEGDPFFDDEMEEMFKSPRKNDENTDDFSDFTWGDEYDGTLPF